MARASTINSPEAPDPCRSIRRSYDMQFHGRPSSGGGNCPTSVYYKGGGFGRLFPALPALRVEPHLSMHLSKRGRVMDGNTPKDQPRASRRPGRWIHC